MNHLSTLADLLQDKEISEHDAQDRRSGYWQYTIKIDYSTGGLRSTGSGILLDQHGHFLTALHVLDRPYNATVRFHGDLDGEQTYRASVEKRLCKFERYDLLLGRCALPKKIRPRIPPPILANASPGFNDEVRVYGFKNEVVEERVGKILGQAGRLRATASGRIKFGFEADGLSERKEVTWMTDADAEQGFSGGPVVHAKTGALLGITTSVIQYENDEETDHCYISADGVRRLISAYLRANGARHDPPAPKSLLERIREKCKIF
jgi:hypothetical protein